MSAYAYNAVGPNLAAFSSFTAAEQAAIQKSFDVRQAAMTEADKILTDAGLDQAKLRQAMQTYHQAEQAKLKAAIDSGDLATVKKIMEEMSGGGMGGGFGEKPKGLGRHMGGMM